MIIVTSLSPGHTRQENNEIIDSWKVWGKCYSLNNPSEHSKIDAGDIKIVPINRSSLFDKPLISINSILDFAISTNEDLLFINSDIILRGLPIFKQDGITLISRYDYADTINDAKLFGNGFDAFYIPKNLLHIFPNSVYSLGAAWHDYWTPMIAINKGVPVYSSSDKLAYHKIHETKYSYDEWLWIGEHFRWEFKLDKSLTIPQIAAQTLKKIKSAIVWQ